MKEYSVVMNSNLNKLIKLILFTFIIISLFACTGHKVELQQTLYFINQQDNDTADFIHYHLDGYPFSLELLGSSKMVNDTIYGIQIQIGAYDNPFFEDSLLKLYPDSVTIIVNDIKPTASYSNLSFPYKNKPWKAISLHSFIFDKADLDSEFPNGEILGMEINLEKYAVYNNEPVYIEPIRILDPKFEKIGKTNK
ncbi:MAG: hypothetical protein ABIJ45_08905 [Candidatus Zixiibacteriota bacterium]